MTGRQKSPGRRFPGGLWRLLAGWVPVSRHRGGGVRLVGQRCVDGDVLQMLGDVTGQPHLEAPHMSVTTSMSQWIPSSNRALGKP